MIRSRINASLFFFFIFSGLLGATTITGIVKNANTLTPIAQAKVSVLSFASNDSLIVTAVTNAEGRYQLTVPPGVNVYLTASAPGFQVARVGPVRVDSLSAVFNFNLIPEVLPYSNRLAGAVVNDSTNQPVTGAKVYLLTSASTSMFTYTDALGKYSFLNIIPGTYQVKAEKEGFTAATYPQTFTITATSVFNEVIFRLRPSGGIGLNGSLSGIVNGVGSNGTLIPLVGATVKVAVDSILSGYSTVTGEQGKYSIASLPSGRYFVSVYFQGYSTVNSALQINPGANTFNCTLTQSVVQNGIVSGKVVNDAGSLPLAGVAIYLGGINATTPGYTATSDSLGKYRIINVIPGIYQLKAQLTGYQPFTAAQPVVVAPGAIIEGLTIRMVPTGTGTSARVTGRVIEAGTGGTPPLIGATVKFLSNNSTTAVTVPVDSLGNYVLASTNPGTYVVTASAPRFVSVSKTVTLVAGNNTQNFELRRDTIIAGNNLFAGKVFDDSLNIPVAGVLIEMNPVGILPYIVPTYSDSTGRFRFTNLPPASYQLKASKQGYTVFNTAQPIVITATTQIENYAIRLVRSGGTQLVTLKGTVLAATGAVIPVKNAIVKLSASNTVGFSTNTDSLGAYRFSGIPGGTYNFSVNANGYNPYNGSVVLSQGTYTKNVELLPLSTTGTGLVNGKVWFDGSSAPVKGAVVEFVPRSIAAGGESFRSVTDSAGKYSARIRTGSYFVSVKYSRENVGYFYTEYFDNAPTIATATPVNVANNDTITGVSFGIPQTPVTTNHTVVITGKVADTLARPLANAKVQYYLRGLITPAVVQGTVTDANGNYAIVFQYVSADTVRKSVAVSAVKEGYKIEFFREKAALDFANWLPLMNDTVFTSVDFTLEPIQATNMFTVSGMVKDSLNNVIPGASVIVINKANNQVQFGTAGTTGEYSVQVKAGNYLVLFVAGGFAPQFYNNAATWERATPVTVSANVTGINAFLRPLSVIASISRLTGIISNSQGAPVAGVLVGLLNSSGQMTGYDFTGDDGSYEIDGLNSGTYSISVTHQQFTSVQMPFVFDPLMGSSAVVNMNLTQSPTGVEPIPAQSKDYSLLANYPNPFNPSTAIRFTLPQASPVTLRVYDMTGTQVAELLRTTLAAGEHTVQFNAGNLTSGTYIYELRAGSVVKRNKMLLLK